MPETPVRNKQDVDDLVAKHNDEKPNINHIWAAVQVFAGNDLKYNDKPSHPERELWYAPSITIKDAFRAEAIFREYNVDTVYDLGAGDCRFALWLERRDYDVIAYELNESVAEGVKERFHLDDMTLKQRDYYKDFEEMISEDSAVVTFGSTNKLPYVPNFGIAIEGYWEIGVTAYHNGDKIAQW